MTAPYRQKNGTLAADEANIALDVLEHGTIGIDVRGTFTADITPEATIDNINWFTLSINPIAGGAAVTTITAAGAWTANCAGLHKVRLRIDNYTSGTATVNLLTCPDAGMSTNVTATVETNFDYLEDAAHTTGDRGAFVLAVRNDANAALSGTNLDYTPISVDSAGNPQVDILTVTPGGAAANLGKAEDAAHTTGDTGVFVLGVSNEANTALAADGDYIALATDTEGSQRNIGNRAHDAVDAGAPVKIGYKAYAFDGTAPQTDAAEADRVNAISDLSGIQYVQTAHPFFWSASVDYAAAQTNATIKTAPGVGLKLYITDIFLSNGAVAGNVTLLDGSAGAVKWECYPAINGGAAWSPKNPIALTANTLLAITSTTVTTHSLTINGFVAA